MIGPVPRPHLRLRGRDPWEPRIDALFELLCSADRGNLAVALELLARLSELRGSLQEPVDPVQREQLHALLDEFWEGACAAVYGDLESVRRHTFHALEVAELLRRLAAAG